MKPKKPNHNTQVMIDAIKAELSVAKKQKRDPRTSNVIALFRPKMKPKLSEADLVTLFDVVFATYLDVTGHPTEYRNN